MVADVAVFDAFRKHPVFAPDEHYVQSLLAWTRNNPALSQGLSPRAGQGLIRAAASWALLHGRDWVLPEDVQAVLPAVAGHRLRPKQGGSAAQLVAQLLISVPVPD